MRGSVLSNAYGMAEDRRRCPTDDIVTRPVHEFAFFVILLAVAGNETTRNALSNGINAFFDNPDQWEELMMIAGRGRGRRKA